MNAQNMVVIFHERLRSLLFFSLSSIHWFDKAGAQLETCEDRCGVVFRLGWHHAFTVKQGICL